MLLNIENSHPLVDVDMLSVEESGRADNVISLTKTFNRILISLVRAHHRQKNQSCKEI
jgi:hypothetical protein